MDWVVFTLRSDGFGRKTTVTTSNSQALFLPMKILVAEDDKTLCELLGDVLASAGHDVIMVNDGQNGVEMCQKVQFDLAIVDIYMPRKDGLEMIQHIKRNALCKHIIAMTGMTHVGSWPVQAAMALGADAVLEKPFSFDDLLAAVGQYRPVLH
jgi:CheY-like chemotaxis protein